MTKHPATQVSTPESVDVAIIGAGIGGLAAAVALRQAGIDAHVFERTKVLAEVGGAVVIRRPSVALLENWGLHSFYDQAVAIGVIEMRDRGGAVVRTVDADFIGDGQAYSTHRHDVHSALVDVLPAESLHLGHRAESVSNDGDGGHAEVRFADGHRVTAPLVVGADGIRSVARSTVVDDEPKFRGLVVLRGIAPVEALPDGATNDRILMWADGPRMITTLPLRAGTQVAMDTIISQDTPPDDLWTAEVPTAELLDHFAGFDPGLLHLIESGTVPVRANPVYDRDPIHTWAAGRIVLLGDAAHPMAPRQGQGANQAIQDAGALADGIARFGLGDVAGALRYYEEQRVELATSLQTASRSTPQAAMSPARS